MQSNHRYIKFSLDKFILKYRYSLKYDKEEYTTLFINFIASELSNYIYEFNKYINSFYLEIDSNKVGYIDKINFLNNEREYLKSITPVETL